MNKDKANKNTKCKKGIAVVFKKTAKKSTSITRTCKNIELNTAKIIIKFWDKGIEKADFFSLRQLKT